ncbi:MAG: metallophosphoesterase family protein [Prevotellaceae bacterium]|jgi:calcineurin-like phosphoesterase family protein|nr:metallophosphoesterase family protein [Prevotellaceae bacterium]
MIFFTADTHFCHANIISLCGRPFSDVAQMNETLIANWNECVNHNDEIYILGDFAFRGSTLETNRIAKSLNGRKHLIRGNHDKFADDTKFDRSNFEWIKDYYVLNYRKTKFVLFHYPILEWDGYYRGSVHLYGHVHNSGMDGSDSDKFKMLGKRAINVGVDLNDYRPVSIEKILTEL